MPDVGGGQPVTVTVVNGGSRVVGVHVYFLAADDSVVMATDTGADGTAGAVMPAGGSVTFLDPFHPASPPVIGKNDLVTFMGVKPGDHLVLTRSARDPVSVIVTTAHVANATAYDVVTTCGTGTLAPSRTDPTADPTGKVDLEGCGGTADVAILARSVDPKTKLSTPILGLVHPGATLVNDGPLDLTGDAYASPAAMTVTYAHAPSGTLRVKHAPLLPHGPLGPFEETVTGDTVTIDEPAVAAASSAIMTTIEGAMSTHEVLDWGPSSASYTLDFDGVLLPEMLGRPTFEIAAGRVTWSQTAQGAAPDATDTFLNISRSAPARTWTWLVIAPYTPGVLAIPKLPSDIADWTPAAGDTVFVDHVATLKLTGGYDALRARTIDFGANDLALVAGSSGHLATVISDGSLRVTAPPASLRDPRAALRTVFGARR